MRPLNHDKLDSRISIRGQAIRLGLSGMVGLLILAPAPGTIRSGLVAQDERAFVPEATVVEIKKPATEEEDGEKSSAEDQAEGAVKQAVSPQMSRLFPIGRPFKGVRIPSYTGDSLTSVVEAEVMRRIDEERLDMTQLVITSFGEGEEPDTRIFMDRAIYDMTTEKLTSQTPTRIVQPRFDMVGDRMTFDNKTQIGHMIGNVKMRIFEVDHVFSGGMLGGAGSESETETETEPDSE